MDWCSWSQQAADKPSNFLIHDFHVLCALKHSVKQHSSNVKENDKHYKARHTVLPLCCFISDYNVDVVQRLFKTVCKPSSSCVG